MDNTLFNPTGNWDNHRILLKLALEATRDSYESRVLPILELGCGEGSTPVLREYLQQEFQSHAIIRTAVMRTLMSYDYAEDWANKYGAVHVKDWDTDVDWNRRYSVALVDESPGEQRHKSLMLLKNVCDIVIVHDSEPRSEEGYMLQKVWPLYRYKVDLVSRGAWATAMSNTFDVTKWVGPVSMPDGQKFEIRPFEVRKSLAFCSVAFGEKYIEQQHRLKESILKIYPDAKLFFYQEELPQGARTFSESLYGFKAHAIAEAWDYGFKDVIWMDTAMILLKPVNYPEEMFQKLGVLAVTDTSTLSDVCSDACLTHFKTIRGDIKDQNLVGGSFYYFSFKYPIGREIFLKWLEAETAGVFGSQEEESTTGLQGHRHDETCMAMSLYKNGSRSLPGEVLGYNTLPEQDPIMIKKHFK